MRSPGREVTVSEEPTPASACEVPPIPQDEARNPWSYLPVSPLELEFAPPGRGRTVLCPQLVEVSDV